jgi:Holliday junction DNA helicase RuvA
MIGRLTGMLLEKKPPQVVLDVGGVGYELDVPMSTFYNLPELGQRLVLYTHLSVREDAHLLYGFGSEAERALFRQLLKVNGVGPKLALSVLSGLSVEQLQNAVSQQEVGVLTRIPGIGKRTAERLILELKDKLGPVAVTSSTAPDGAASNARRDLSDALLALGYSEREAGRAMDKVPADAPLEEGIRTALKLLSRTE